MKIVFFLLIVSIIFFYLAFTEKKLKRPNDNLEIWRKNNWNKEKIYWVTSIIIIIISIFIAFSKLYKGKKSMILFYSGFYFLFQHMIGEWFLKKCDFEVKRNENTFKQYFIDNILGNCIIKPNRYEVFCNKKKLIRNTNIIINRNLSIFLLSLFLLSFHVDLPYFGKTTIIN